VNGVAVKRFRVPAPPLLMATAADVVVLNGEKVALFKSL
jgi:hypothetical protein